MFCVTDSGRKLQHREGSKMISTKNLTKYFGSFCAVDNLTIHVQPGELYCFLGPNGAGKTTTIKMLANLMHPTEGSIKIADRDFKTNAMAAKACLGYIPDMPYLYERLTAAEFMDFVGDLYRIEDSKKADKTEEYLDLFGLQDYRNSLIKDFSHGMRQRLIYAATFLHEPSVLLIDEPLIALDPYTIRMIKDLLISKAREGMAIFVTTHILALAQDIADRIGIISNGRLIAEGTYSELLKEYGGSNLEDIFINITTK